MNIKYKIHKIKWYFLDFLKGCFLFLMAQDLDLIDDCYTVVINSFIQGEISNRFLAGFLFLFNQQNSCMFFCYIFVTKILHVIFKNI